MSYDGEKIPTSQKIIEAEDINTESTEIERFVNVGIDESAFATPPDHAYPPAPTHAPYLNLGYGETGGYEAGRFGGSFAPDGGRQYTSGFRTDGYIDKTNILKPEFYGSPAPRMEAVSSQVHYRSTGTAGRDSIVFSPSTTGGAYEAIPGTAARLKLRDSAEVYISASFYCFELGGVQWIKDIHRDSSFAASVKKEDYGGQSKLSGRVALNIQGSKSFKNDYIGSTIRRVYTSLVAPYGTARDKTGGPDINVANKGRLHFHMLGRHQHSIIYRVSLDAGVYDIGLVFKCSDEPSKLNSTCSIRHDEDLGWGYVQQTKCVFFKARNMVIDAMYNGRQTPEDMKMEQWRYRNPFDDQRY